jgi:hypothetical protein
MDRENLLVLCERFADRRGRIMTGRVSVEICDPTIDPVPEIIRSFRLAEISESEKNALLSLVCDLDDGEDVCAETACIRDPYADERDGESDDDELG